MYTLLLGVSYEVQGTTGDTVTDINWSSSVVLPGGTVNLIYLIHYLIVCLLLLLSGDVELNPGPMIDDQPSCHLFAKYLKPLADWKPFALCLPGITQSHVNIIDRNAHHNKIVTLHKNWLQVNPQASWRDVITALETCHENKVAKTVKHQITQSSGSTDDNMEVTTSDTTGKLNYR